MSQRPVAATVRPLYAGNVTAEWDILLRVWDVSRFPLGAVRGKVFALPQYPKVVPFSSIFKKRR